MSHAVATDAVAAAMRARASGGHPDASWSIVLDASVDAVPSPGDAAQRLDPAVGPRPQLGPVPEVSVVAPDAVDAAARHMADAPYRLGGSTLRVALVPEAGRVLVAGHEGAIDGLGLLALLGVILDAEPVSSARGVGAARPEGSFALLATRRMFEAALRPPTRVAPPRLHPGSGGSSASLGTETEKVGTGAVVGAAARAVRRWNDRAGEEAVRRVVAVGASHRPGSSPSLGHDAAWMRLRIDRDDDESVRAALAAAPPLPVGKPMAADGLLGRLNRLVSRRLGSTLLVSNLGAVDRVPGLRSLAFYPVAYGRSGVSVGAASVAGTTTITARCRRRDFAEADVRAFVALVVVELVEGGRGAPSRRAPGLTEPLQRVR